MEKFWKSKKFWIGIALVGISVFIYYYFFNKDVSIKDTEIIKNGNNNEPYSQIQSLSKSDWKSKDFRIRILDEDLKIGIKKGFCQYKALSYNSVGEEVSSGWKARKCNDTQVISVGPDKDCRFEGRNSCWIYVRSQNKENNWYHPSESELSIKSYNIDWTKPDINTMNIESNKIKISVNDNFKVVGCLLYIDGKNQGKMTFINSNNQEEKSLEKEFTIIDPGTHSLYTNCIDMSGNWGEGESRQFIVNTPPIINYCKASPTSGQKDTKFQFSISSEDIDNDDLSYSWNFDDGTSSKEENPEHFYSKIGTYKPTVVVSDGTKESMCSTVWITIAK